MYHCNALASFYTTIVLAAIFHVTGIFHLPHLIEHFGELMSWAIIISFFFTFLIYTLAVTCHYGGKPLRMSGNVIYDVFMGASLNPRLFTSRAFALGRKRWDGVDLTCACLRIEHALHDPRDWAVYQRLVSDGTV